MKYTFLPCTMKSSWQHCPFPRASTLRLSHPLTSKAHRGMYPLQVLLCALAVCSARSPGPWGTAIAWLPHGRTNQEPRVVPVQAAPSPVGPSTQQQPQRSQVHLGRFSIGTTSFQEAGLEGDRGLEASYCWYSPKAYPEGKTGDRHTYSIAQAKTQPHLIPELK